MGLNVLGYNFQLLRRCPPGCGHEGSSHLSPILVLRVFIAIHVQQVAPVAQRYLVTL